ncbi:MAG: PKD domain-containing protein [Methanobacteriota archaeon]|nr:MAG: PKD domain-containing protein [Euryarchaeota archaeon]
MRRRNGLLLALVMASAILVVGFAPSPNSAYSSGLSGSASTGCGGCHASTANSSMTVAIDGIPNEYDAQQTYQLTITVTGGPSGDAGGFDLEVDNGTFLNPGASAKLESGTEIVHSDANSRTWTVDWLAPSSGSGIVTFEIVGLAADGTGDMVADEWNLASYTSTEFRVSNEAPTNVSILAQPSSPTEGEEVSLSGSAIDPDHDSLIYNWSFGDGSDDSTGQNVKHVYNSAGTFTVVLTVDDGNGHRVSEQLTITVQEEPIPYFDVLLAIVAVVVTLVIVAVVMRSVFSNED